MNRHIYELCAKINAHPVNHGVNANVNVVIKTYRIWNTPIAVGAAS